MISQIKYGIEFPSIGAWSLGLKRLAYPSNAAKCGTQADIAMSSEKEKGYFLFRASFN